MKSVLSFLVFGIFVSSLFALQPIEGNMGVLTDGISNTKDKDYSVAFNILINRVSAKNAIGGEMKSYDNADKMINDFLQHKLDYIMMNPYYFLKNQKRLNKQVAFYWSVRKYKKKFEKMLILAPKDKEIKNVMDLRDKDIMLKDDNFMGKVVLDKALLMSEKHHGYKEYIHSFIPVKTHSRAILQLYFGKTDAAIVPQYAYEFMCEMNPAVEKKVKIIYKTEAIFMPILSMVHSKTPSELIERMKITSKSLHTTEDGKNVLSLFKMTDLDALEYEELQKLREYYEEYEKLQKEYGDKK